MNNKQNKKEIHTKTFDKEIKFLIYLLIFLIIGYIILDKVVLERMDNRQNTNIEEKKT